MTTTVVNSILCTRLIKFKLLSRTKNTNESKPLETGSDLVSDRNDIEDIHGIADINDINELFWGYLYPPFETLLRLISSKRPIDNAMLPSFDKPGGGGAP